MPVVETSRKHLSEVVKGLGAFTNSAGTNYSYAVVDVKGAAAVDPIGTLVVWDDTDAFEPYLAQDIAATGASVLPNGAKVAVTVGTPEAGVGTNRADVTLTTTATRMVVLYRHAEIDKGGLEEGSITAPNLAEFYTELETQGVAVYDPATNVIPSYVVA
jgi:hypothetical protein